MTHSKALGLLVVALVAVSVMFATAAHAANFTASSYPTASTATSEKGNDDIKTEAGSIECKVHYAGSALSGPSETMTITPTYSECQAFGFLSATVNMNGCYFILHSNGAIDIHCASGSLRIEITASTCKMHLAVQTSLSSISLSNSGPGISMRFSVTGIAYTVTTDGFLCPFSGTGSKTGGSYTQNNSVQISSTNGATLDIG